MSNQSIYQISSSNLDNNQEVFVFKSFLGAFQFKDMATLNWDGTNHQLYLSPMISPYDDVYINFDGTIRNSETERALLAAPSDILFPEPNSLKELTGDTYFSNTGNLFTDYHIDENNSFLKISNCSLFFNGSTVTPYSFGTMFDMNCEFHGSTSSDGKLVILIGYDYIL